VCCRLSESSDNTRTRNDLLTTIEQEGNGDLRGLIANWDKLLTELGVDNVKGMAEKTVIDEQQFVTRTLLRTFGRKRSVSASSGVA